MTFNSPFPKAQFVIFAALDVEFFLSISFPAPKELKNTNAGAV